MFGKKFANRRTVIKKSDLNMHCNIVLILFIGDFVSPILKFDQVAVFTSCKSSNRLL